MKAISKAVIWAGEVVSSAAAGGAIIGQVAYEERPTAFANISQVGVLMGAVALTEAIIVGYELNKLIRLGSDNEI